MLSERMLTAVMSQCTKQYLQLKPTDEERVPNPVPGQRYMLYMHVPFCERLCPYCSFNRFPFSKERAVPYFANMRKEMLMLKDLGYDFDSVYIGGGTPTIMLDELCDTIDLARETFSIKEVSSETNPNHLIPSYLDKLQGRVQRLSVGVQSFDNGLLKQMDRYDKYGSGEEILERVREASPYFTSLNVDMIFNFPAQTEDILINDIERVIESGSGQTTFYPLMASPSVARSLARTVGKVDYKREQRFYRIIDELLSGGEDPLFVHGSAWTFNRRSKDSARAAVASSGAALSGVALNDSVSNGAISSGVVSNGSASGDVAPSDVENVSRETLGDVSTPASAGADVSSGAAGAANAEAGTEAAVSAVNASDGAAGAAGDGVLAGVAPASASGSLNRAAENANSAMIDEYVVDYEEYPAIGSGGITYLGSNLYVNTFSVVDYNKAIESGRMSLMGKTTFSKRDRMRYRFMMQLFGLRLDKRQFKEDFGCSVEAGLPVEVAFMRAAGAFATDTAEEFTLTPKGRYLTVVMMRQFFIGVNNLRDQARAALTGEERELIFGE